MRRKSIEDPNYKIRHKFTHWLGNVLRYRPVRIINRGNPSKLEQLLGCSINEFRAHIEHQFLPSMTWENYGRNGWEVDHIKGCAEFDLTDPAQQRVCFHYTNLRPLWRHQNRKRNEATHDPLP